MIKGAQSLLNGLNSLAKLFKSVVCNPCPSSPSLTILVPWWFIIISLVFSYLCKVLFSGFFQFNGNFVDAQNNSKYRDWAPLKPQSNDLGQKWPKTAKWSLLSLGTNLHLWCFLTREFIYTCSAPPRTLQCWTLGGGGGGEGGKQRVLKKALLSVSKFVASPPPPVLKTQKINAVTQVSQGILSAIVVEN